MKKNYLTPDVDILDFRTMCLDGDNPMGDAGVASPGQDLLDKPSRRGGIGPAGL